MATTIETCCCLFCYRVWKYDENLQLSWASEKSNDYTNYHESAKSLQNQFLLLLNRHQLKNKMEIQDLVICSSLPKFTEKLKNVLLPCFDCSRILRSFCDYYKEIEELEIKLKWRLWTLSNIVSCSEKVKARVKNLQETFVQNRAQLGCNNEVADELMSNLNSFRKKLATACSRKVQLSYPALKLTRCDEPERKHKPKSTKKRKVKKLKVELDSKIKTTNIFPVKAEPLDLDIDMKTGVLDELMSSDCGVLHTSSNSNAEHVNANITSIVRFDEEEESGKTPERGCDKFEVGKSVPSPDVRLVNHSISCISNSEDNEDFPTLMTSEKESHVEECIQIDKETEASKKIEKWTSPNVLCTNPSSVQFQSSNDTSMDICRDDDAGIAMDAPDKEFSNDDILGQSRSTKQTKIRNIRKLSDIAPEDNDHSNVQFLNSRTEDSHDAANTELGDESNPQPNSLPHGSLSVSYPTTENKHEKNQEEYAVIEISQKADEPIHDRNKEESIIIKVNEDNGIQDVSRRKSLRMRFKCHTCSKLFASEYNLRKHIQSTCSVVRDCSEDEDQNERNESKCDDEDYDEWQGRSSVAGCDAELVGNLDFESNDVDTLDDDMDVGVDEKNHTHSCKVKDDVDGKNSNSLDAKSEHINYVKQKAVNGQCNIGCTVKNCRRRFAEKESLNKHLSLHGKFKCFFCDAVKGFAPLMSIHELSHCHKEVSENTVNRCPRCEYSSKIREKYIRHHLQVHMNLVSTNYQPRSVSNRGRRIKCDVCNIQIALENGIHHKTHHDLTRVDPKSVFHCDGDGCKAYFLKLQQLERHKVLMHGKNPLKCSHCDQVFGNKDKLILHRQRVHRFDAKYPCTFAGCCKVFLTELNRINHMIVCLYKKSTILNPVICEKCGRSFKRTKHLNRHIIIHKAGKKPRRFLCQVCGKTFPERAKLDQHSLSHSGPSSWQFKCGKCGKKCMTKQKLDEHENTHSKAKPFTCEECGLQYAHRHNFRHLLKKMHGIILPDPRLKGSIK